MQSGRKVAKILSRSLEVVDSTWRGMIGMVLVRVVGITRDHNSASGVDEARAGKMAVRWRGWGQVRVAACGDASYGFCDG